VVQIRQTAPLGIAEGQALVKVRATGINYPEIVIRRVYDYREAAEAHRHLESGRSMGKLVLSFDN